jgi:hypothetical protein
MGMTKQHPSYEGGSATIEERNQRDSDAQGKECTLHEASKVVLLSWVAPEKVGK